MFMMNSSCWIRLPTCPHRLDSQYGVQMLQMTIQTHHKLLVQHQDPVLQLYHGVLLLFPGDIVVCWSANDPHSHITSRLRALPGQSVQLQLQQGQKKPTIIQVTSWCSMCECVVCSFHEYRFSTWLLLLLLTGGDTPPAS